MTNAKQSLIVLGRHGIQEEKVVTPLLIQVGPEVEEGTVQNALPKQQNSGRSSIPFTEWMN
jgi:hypothetical protein